MVTLFVPTSAQEAQEPIRPLIAGRCFSIPPDIGTEAATVYQV